MAPAKDNGAFPGIIREMREVRAYLVRGPLRIRLRRANLTITATAQICGSFVASEVQIREGDESRGLTEYINVEGVRE